jgi:phosphatidylserine/phosphatidylglycerophosphate/cardiolipin synthase-like enzyme
MLAARNTLRTLGTMLRRAIKEATHERPGRRGRCLASSAPMIRTTLQALAVALIVATQALAQEVHYSPKERLDAIDAQLIATAMRSIDLASYALTDPIVLDALNAAEQRGVVIRIVLDPASGTTFVKLGDLSDNGRIKRGCPFRSCT